MMKIPPTLPDALVSLRPGAEWTCGETYDSIQWMDNSKTKPTEQEVQEELIRLQNLYVYLEYQRKRELEYPSWEEQMDTLYHEGYDGWKASIQVIKNKYPKPT